MAESDAYEKIEFVFLGARNILKEIDDPNFSDEWLYDLQSDAAANLNDSSWIDSLKGYFRGIHAVGAIGIEHIDDLYKLLLKYEFIS